MISIKLLIRTPDEFSDTKKRRVGTAANGALYTIYVLDHRRLFIFCPKLPIKLELEEDIVVILQIKINYIAFCSLLVVTCGVTLSMRLGE